MATSIFPYTCWARFECGGHRRLLVCATGHQEAVRAGFVLEPKAIGMSCHLSEPDSEKLGPV